MEINRCISQLLYKHDCVIVPALGGFVANFAGAEVNSFQNNFYPPFKNIIFNKNLLQNDGLLAHYVASTLKISYEEANKQIAQFVEKCNYFLATIKRIELENIGILYIDNEQNIQFIQATETNYLIDSFGLSSFHLPAIIREEGVAQEVEKKVEIESKIKVVTQKTEVKFVDRPPISNTAKKSVVRRYAVAMIAVPLVALLIWIPIKMDLFKNKNVQYSNLNPFATETSEVVKATVDTSVKKQIATSTTVKTDSLEAKANTVVDTTKVTKTALEIQVSQPLTVKAYYLIAGSFGNVENAENLVMELKQKGFSNASIVGKSENGLIRVSYGQYTNNADAHVALQAVKAEQGQAWVLKQ